MEVELRRGGRGDFIVTADGVTLWDKKRMGGFPDEEDLVDDLRDQAAAAGPPTGA